MTRYVIDPSTLVELVGRDLRVDPNHQLVAPNSPRSEALQLLLDEVRQGKRSEKAAVLTHEQLTGLKIRLLGYRVSRTTGWRIAIEHGWDTLRDAEYLAITQLQADALITLDPDLAAKAHDIVAVAPIESLFTTK